MIYLTTNYFNGWPFFHAYSRSILDGISYGDYRPDRNKDFNILRIGFLFGVYTIYLIGPKEP